jgi:hypothetical protein
MRRLFAILAVAAMMAGCESSRHGLPCLGITESDQKVPGVHYEVSIKNVVVGIIFSQTLIVPAVVVLKEFECPMTGEPGREGGTKG